MKSRQAGIWLAVASACLVITLVLLDTRSSSPGPISAVHARSADIDDDDCVVCHGGSPAEMRAACAACHADIESDVASSTGFHGGIADAARCGLCHSEHHGEQFDLVGPGAFALAGVPDRSAYAHAGLGFELSGKHTSGLTCQACHANADVELLAKGQRRFTGLSQSCASCHDDPHAGELADCRSCHGESEPFARVAEFEHPTTFALVGVHARAGCIECHPRGSTFAIEAGGGEQPTRATRSCEACHESPHSEPFVEASAARGTLARADACATCHPVDGGAFTSPLPLSNADHSATGFALTPPHAQAACTDCHAGLRAPAAHASAFAGFRAAHPGRAPDDCAACHADPHGGQFRSAERGSTDCLACHEREHFTPPAFGIDAHARTDFPLTGAHVEASCHACHAQQLGEPRVFRGTDSRCATCHADAHEGFFAAAAITAEMRTASADCAVCHTTTDFADLAAPDAFDHARWTGFALIGEHASATCSACHATRATPDVHGRTFGRVAETFPGSSQDCATCHVDAHAGYFSRKAPGAQCSTCHDPHGFEGAGRSFEHARWTAFDLQGAHARAECSVCHPAASDDALTQPNALAELVARTTIHAGEGSFQRCATCHADVHAGAFDGPNRPRDERGRASCDRCHTTESFADGVSESFDHGAWTSFALTGVHARAECSSCHPRDTATNGDARTFARASGTSCSDCHVDPHVGQFARSGSTDCSACHTTDSNFMSVRFDHQRDARFALDSTHEKLACNACHVPWPIPGGGTAVRYKPLGVVCGDCHDARRGLR